jgi:hypothetical protein
VNWNRRISNKEPQNIEGRVFGHGKEFIIRHSLFDILRFQSYPPSESRERLLCHDLYQDSSLILAPFLGVLPMANARYKMQNTKRPADGNRQGVRSGAMVVSGSPAAAYDSVAGFLAAGFFLAAFLGAGFFTASFSAIGFFD